MGVNSVVGLDKDGYQTSVDYFELGLAMVGAGVISMTDLVGLGAVAGTAVGAGAGVVAANVLGAGSGFADVDYFNAAFVAAVAGGVRFALDMPQLAVVSNLVGNNQGLVAAAAAGIGDGVAQKYIPKFWLR